MTISFIVYGTGLGIIMGVLGYLTAKIINIEALNIKLYQQAYPPKFPVGSYVHYTCSEDIYVVKDYSFNKSNRRYTYTLVNTRSYNTYNEIEELCLVLYDKPKEDKEE